MALLAVTIQALRLHRWQQYRAYQPLGFHPERVFPTPQGGMMNPVCLSYAFLRICKKLDIYASIHSLRHTHASQLIAAGVPLKVISDRLGHNSIRITADTYGHLIRGVDEQAAEMINQNFV